MSVNLKLFALAWWITLIPLTHAGISKEIECTSKDSFIMLYADWHNKYYSVQECSKGEGDCRAARVYRVALICAARDIGVYDLYQKIIDNPENPLQVVHFLNDSLK